MSLQPLVFTGCGRSGTGWVAEVLRRSGVDCGHERLFAGEPEFEDQGALLPESVESSWFAAPFLCYLWPATVVHLVRHPLTWIDSWMRSRPFRYPTVRAYYKKWCPDALNDDSPIEGAMAHWVRWNRLVEKWARYRVRIEDRDERPFTQSLARSGRVPDQLLRSAVQETPPQNHKGGQPRRLRWNDLPRGEWQHEVRKMAEEYGYK